MTDLVPCPLCGGTKGYKLRSDSSHWEVLCKTCDKHLTDSDRMKDSATAWNEAGAYAEGLRAERDRLAELCRHVHDRILRGDSDKELLDLLEEAWTMKPEAINVDEILERGDELLLDKIGRKQMELEIKVTQKIDAAVLEIIADVRYWEDATVEGADTIPCRVGDSWCPTIEIATGKITDWPAGVTADVHFKVCDCGEYWLRDSSGERVAKFTSEYVIDWACPGDEGYGDYIIMKIDADGQIQNWSASADDLDEGDLIAASEAE